MWLDVFVLVYYLLKYLSLHRLLSVRPLGGSIKQKGHVNEIWLTSGASSLTSFASLYFPSSLRHQWSISTPHYIMFVISFLLLSWPCCTVLYPSPVHRRRPQPKRNVCTGHRCQEEEIRSKKKRYLWCNDHRSYDGVCVCVCVKGKSAPLVRHRWASHLSRGHGTTC